MLRSDSRILTTHAGSLPRPPSLTALHAARFAGESVDEAALRRETEAATREVVRRQREIGIDVGNNGEVGRESFFTYVQHRMSGFGGHGTRRGMADILRHPSYVEHLLRTHLAEKNVSLLNAPRVIGEVRYVDPEPIRSECAELRRILDEEGSFPETFVSSPSPGIVAAAVQNEHYPDLAGCVRAVADALRTEYRAIVEAGFVLQIDAPDLAMERHTLFQDAPLEEFLAFARTVAEATSSALEEIPRDRVRLHVCWGNYEGPHDADVPLEEIWEVLGSIPAGAILLSMANPRHAHEVRVLEQLEIAPELVLIPGVIDTTTNYVEHPETVADRIERVARVLGDPKRVLAGTDCGFETAAGFGPVVPELVWAKLGALVEGARIASRRLFG